MVSILMIIGGAALVLWGADRLTDGAVALAERMRIPQLVIGLTIVALGTSAPEFCVSLVSALKGTADLAVGNVVGSNVFNTMLIVGVAAMVAPMSILPLTVKRDIPLSVVASMALAAMVLMDGEVSRLDAAILFAGFLAFMWLTLRNAKVENSASDDAPTKQYSLLKALGFLLLGLACLVAGSNIFVDGATDIAQQLGVSEAVIGLTIVAGGTSLPELATTVVAARKGNSGIAIGNVLGSNVMNILLIVGGAGLICPMTVSGITWVDFAMLTGSVLLLWLFCFTKYTVARWEGALLSALFIAYITWLVVGAMA
ncbi:MAG: calcium/sodium antiporter [Prevotella sp.]|nr:calcium/sodium antiporter [Prevotella sp.]